MKRVVPVYRLRPGMGRAGEQAIASSRLPSTIRFELSTTSHVSLALVDSIRQIELELTVQDRARSWEEHLDGACV
jgi:hypothetical protein